MISCFAIVILSVIGSLFSVCVLLLYYLRWWFLLWFLLWGLPGFLREEIERGLYAPGPRAVREDLVGRVVWGIAEWDAAKWGDGGVG